MGSLCATLLLALALAAPAAAQRVDPLALARDEPLLVDGYAPEPSQARRRLGFQRLVFPAVAGSVGGALLAVAAGAMFSRLVRRWGLPPESRAARSGRRSAAPRCISWSDSASVRGLRRR